MGNQRICGARNIWVVDTKTHNIAITRQACTRKVWNGERVLAERDGVSIPTVLALEGKPTQAQMRGHWKTSHGGPNSPWQAHERCNGSRKAHYKYTLSAHIAMVRQNGRFMTQGPWRKCSSPFSIGSSRTYHLMALRHHRYKYDHKSIHQCSEKGRETDDRFFDKKAFGEDDYDTLCKTRFIQFAIIMTPEGAYSGSRRPCSRPANEDNIKLNALNDVLM